MRTNIVLDNELVSEASGHLDAKREMVDLPLREFVAKRVMQGGGEPRGRV